jgi:UPF0755 protein
MLQPSPRTLLLELKRRLIYVGVLLAYSHFFGAIDTHAVPGEFVIQPGTSITEAANLIAASGVVRSSWALQIALHNESRRPDIRAGGYTIGKNMDAWTLAKILTEPPAIAFVTFPPGIRKEQMGDILANELNWSDAQKKDWNTVATNPDPNFVEGVYYPDTYLIPSDQSPSQIAARMRGRFTDVFAPYAKEAQRQKIAWSKVLTLASIVDREAAKDDKALVAGILWNRLDTGMKLQADATLQYIKGAEGNWWPQPLSADKYLVSPFNTYQHTGLPPHPIDNPSLASIDAVLHPVNTDCLFYLHDNSHQIHCSLTYAGQVKNVNTYLK